MFTAIMAKTAPVWIDLAAFAFDVAAYTLLSVF